VERRGTEEEHFLIVMTPLLDSYGKKNLEMTRESCQDEMKTLLGLGGHPSRKNHRGRNITR